MLVGAVLVGAVPVGPVLAGVALVGEVLVTVRSLWWSGVHRPRRAFSH